MWQQMQINLHVKTRPSHILVKSVLQVSLVAVALSLREYAETAHAVCFLVLIASYFVFLIRIPPYNYDR